MTRKRSGGGLRRYAPRSQAAGTGEGTETSRFFLASGQGGNSRRSNLGCTTEKVHVRPSGSAGGR
jgi:hypothetical protein